MRQDVVTPFNGGLMSVLLGVETAVRRVAIVESRNLVRHGLEKVLAADDSTRVVAAVADPGGLNPAGERPDVVVLGLTARAGEADVATIGALAERSRVLVLSDFADGVRMTDVLRAGAYGCVIDHADDDELLRAVDTVARGGFHVSPGLASRLRSELSRPAASVPSVLGRREVETLRWLAAGLTHGQIARRMGLTETTVSTYVKRIRGKLNVGNKADLTRLAIEWGLLESRPGRTPSALPAA